MLKRAKTLIRRAGRVMLPKHRPDFMIIGAQKSGTTSLHFYLRQHPGLRASEPKEVHFFDRDIYFGKNIRQYEKHFRGIGEAKYFESSPSYLYTPGCARKINEFYPDIKLVLLLRDPVKRAYSAWNHYKDLFESDKYIEAIKHKPRRGGNHLYDELFKDKKTFPTFRECIDIELELIRNGKGYEPALLRRGLYIEQLENYYKYFDENQFLIIGFKDLILETSTTLNRVLHFLDLESQDSSGYDLAPRGSRTYKSPMSESDRSFLNEFYAEPNRRLFEKVGPINW